MVRGFPARGSYVVGLAYNQLFGSTEVPRKESGEIVNHLFFAHSYTKNEAMHYARQGFTVFIVEPAFGLSIVELCQDIPKLKPIDIPKETVTYFSVNQQTKQSRTESYYGCKYCSVRYLKVDHNAAICEVCKVHLRCKSCGCCICER